MESARYSCSQPDLYSCLRVGWSNYARYQVDLQKASPLFTVKYGEDSLAEVEAAFAMLDEDARNALYRRIRIHLAEQSESCTALWAMLKSYIVQAYPDSMHDVEWKAAGWRFYEPAANMNWPSVNSLMFSGYTYLTDNLVYLQSKNVLPEDFLARFTAAKDTFAKTYNEFIAAESSAQKGTNTKLQANNACHKKLINMFMVASKYFKDDEAIRNDFIFSEVLLKVAGPGTSGFTGIVRDAVSGLVLADVLVAIENRKEQMTTEEDGRYLFLQIAAGKHTLVFSKKGFVTLRIPIDTTPTVVNRLPEIEMIREVSDVPSDEV